MSRRTEDIAARVAAQLGDEALVEKLASLKPSELTSLLLAVHRAQAPRRTFASVAAAHERDELFRASRADVRRLRVVEDAFIAAALAAPGGPFELRDVSPVEPLGLAALTGIDPNNALAALRSAELLADPTASLCLEVAARRRADRTTAVRLATSCRAIRMQPLPAFDGASRHFRLVALVTSAATRDEERAAFADHVHVWLTMLEALSARGVCTVDVRVEVAHTGAPSGDDLAWRDEVLFPSLRERFGRDASRGEHDATRSTGGGSGVGSFECVVDDAREQGKGYYQGFMLHVTVRDARGAWLPFGDGGTVPWLGRILGDRRERLVTSAFGAELVTKRCWLV